MNRRVLKILIISISLFILITACSNNKETLKYDGGQDITARLKIMAVGEKDVLMEEYGDMFRSKYPNIEIEFVNKYTQSNFDKTIEEEKPDVFMLSLEEYKQLVQKDKLYDLSLMFSNDEFDLEGIHPGIVESLRQMGNGRLFGLAPGFQSKAIYYNKDIFDKYGIPYPYDGMTWEEVIQLAKRFPTEDGISGLYMQDFYTFVGQIEWSENLKIVNEKEMKVVLDSKSYRDIFEMILDAYQSKAVEIPFLDSFYVYDPFITGQSAMTMDYYYYINNKINWAQAEKGSNFNLNWDVASAPVDDSDRELSPYFMFGGIFSIHIDSEQKQAAWEFVKFVNSEEYSKANSRTAGFNPTTRTKNIFNPEGKRMEAFYSLKPNLFRNYVHWEVLPKEFGKILDIINSEGKAAMVGAKTLDEAIASMQERGQQLLDQK
ncbi:multiple sugar transport system substrate-binding protein [Fontibacillus solani]|uniref:Multiple sugar transport system substrate-binding protein n=1 Tax=Fontibacillus solani TaxID=1572857 RepID=A0A7W3STG0_9BACL|nr:extracellular solute-binding protein [Fontibacillus solani]MBA9085718.1 multiple sugar transport system substrate-binding protein [Fontibacillus solani]